MDELLSLASKLGTVGFPTLLCIVLFASRKGWYFWDREVAQINATWKARLDASQAEASEWKALALQAHGVVELGLDVVKKRVSPWHGDADGK